MRLHILFILALTVFSIDDHFDFMVNDEGYDCSTVKDLTYRAQKDELDLVYIKERINSYQDKLVTAFEKAEKACNKKPAAKQALFLQTSAKSKLRAPLSSSSSNQISFDSGRPTEHPFVENLSQTLGEIHFKLESLSEPNSDLSKCKEALEEGNNLFDQLSQMLDDITDYWLGQFMPRRFNDLTHLMTACLKQDPITQTGNFTALFRGMDHPFETETTIIREEDFEILFDEPFYDYPFVTAAIESFDLDSSQMGVRVEVLKPTTKGFVLRIYAPEGCKVYSLGISWFATLSLRSYVWTMMVHYDQNELTKANEVDGVMVFKTKVSHPLRIKIPGVATALSGFTFGPQQNPSVEVMAFDPDASCFEIVIKYPKGVDLREVSVSILYYSQSVLQNQLHIASLSDGPLAGGKGYRVDQGDGKVAGQEFHNSHFWKGVSQFSFIKGHNFVLNQELKFEREHVGISFSTDGDCQIKSVMDVVFYSTGKGKIMETLTGSFNQVYWATGHAFEKEGQEERQEKYHVKFHEKFGQVPTVAITLKSFDVDYKYPAVHVYAETITEDGFDIRAVAPKGARVYMFDVSWIATVSEKSLIYTAEFDKNSQVDEDLGKTSEGRGERIYTILLPYPETITNPEIFVGIRGFQFGSSTNARLDVYAGLPKDSHDIEIFVKTWEDTQLYNFEITVIPFEKSSNQDLIKIESEVTGELYDGNGARKEIHDVYLGLEDPIYFVGVNHIDFITGKNFRFSQNMNRLDNNVTVEFDTWADTQIWQVESTIFYTVESRTA